MDDRAVGGFIIGLGVGALIFTLILATAGTLGNDAWVNRYDGIKDVVSEMRNECEAQEGVIDCEWTGQDFEAKEN